jgi:peptide/nickel transport system substrate-binding protein
VGLEVRVVETGDFPADIQDLDGRPRHPLFLKRVGADYLHAHSLLSPFLESGLNYTGFREVDDGEAGRRFSALVAQAAAMDAGEARTLYAQADDLLVKEYAVVVPLLHPDRFHRVRPWVEGLGVDPFNFLTLRALRLAPDGLR